MSQNVDSNTILWLSPHSLPATTDPDTMTINWHVHHRMPMRRSHNNHILQNWRHSNTPSYAMDHMLDTESERTRPAKTCVKPSTKVNPVLSPLT